MKKTIYIKPILSFLIIFSLSGTLIILAQRQTPESKQKKEGGNFDITVQTQNDNPIEIKSIQRINLEVEDTDVDGKTLYKKKSKVSIIFHAGNLNIDPAGNIQFSVTIGDKAFFASGSGNTLYVEMSRDDFDDLTDNSYISFMPGLSAGDAKEKLKEKYKDGEPKEFADKKCCRLDKKLIGASPIVERTNIPSREAKKP
jgi:hypothetical protein